MLLVNFFFFVKIISYDIIIVNCLNKLFIWRNNIIIKEIYSVFFGFLIFIFLKMLRLGK